MFERTQLLQEKRSKELSDLFNNGRFPHSVLFYGPDCSSRLTAALDSARAILKTPILFSKLNSVYAYLSRDVFIALNAKGKMFLNDLTKGSYERFTDELFVLMLTRTFSSLRNEEGGRNTLSASDEENLISLYADLVSVPFDTSKTEELSKKVIKVLSIAENIKEESGFSIKDVRLIKKQSILHSASGEAKIFIIEGLENALPAAKNAFLKILEEPPENTYFIIISSERKAALGDTILSRLVQFSFHAIDTEGRKAFFAAYQRPSVEDGDINTFFLEEGYEESREFKKTALNFASVLLSRRSYLEARDIVLSVFGPVRTRNRKSDILFMLFLNTVAKECIKAFKNKEFMAEPYLKAISDAYNKYRIYNISSRNAMLYLIDELLEF